MTKQLKRQLTVLTLLFLIILYFLYGMFREFIDAPLAALLPLALVILSVTIYVGMLTSYYVQWAREKNKLVGTGWKRKLAIVIGNIVAISLISIGTNYIFFKIADRSCLQSPKLPIPSHRSGERYFKKFYSQYGSNDEYCEDYRYRSS